MNTRPVHIPRPCPALMFAATLGGIAPGFAIAETINISASKDNTLYEYFLRMVTSAMPSATTSSRARPPWANSAAVYSRST